MLKDLSRVISVLHVEHPLHHRKHKLFVRHEISQDQGSTLNIKYVDVVVGTVISYSYSNITPTLAPQSIYTSCTFPKSKKRLRALPTEPQNKKFPSPQVMA